MSRLTLPACLLLALPALAAEQGSPAYRACLDKAVSTAAMIECSGAEAARWDARLNAAYAAIMKSDAWSAATKGLLRDAQRAWIAYRDAACVAEGELTAEGGSMSRIIASGCLAELTEARAKALEASVKSGAPH